LKNIFPTFTEEIKQLTRKSTRLNYTSGKSQCAWIWQQ